MEGESKRPTVYDLFTPQEWENLALLLEEIYTKGNYGFHTIARIFADDPETYPAKWLEGVLGSAGEATVDRNNPRFQSPADALIAGRGIYLYDPDQMLLTAANRDGTIIVCNFQVCALGGNLKALGLPADHFTIRWGRAEPAPFFHAYAGMRTRDGKEMPLDTVPLDSPGGRISAKFRGRRNDEPARRYNIEPWQTKWDADSGSDPTILIPEKPGALDGMAKEYLRWWDRVFFKFPRLDPRNWGFR